MFSLAEIDGSGWLSASQAKQVFKLSEGDLSLIMPCRTDLTYRYYNRSDLEQLAHRKGGFMPPPAAVDAVCRGAYDPNDLSPRRRNLKKGVTWTKVMQQYKGILTKRHQDMIKPFAILPNEHERARGHAIKRYDSKDVEALAERVASEPRPARKSPLRSPSKPSTPASGSSKLASAPVAGSSTSTPGNTASKRRKTIDWGTESDEEYKSSPSKRSRAA